MEITASMIKELRAETHAGIMDCKKALLKSNGNFEGASKFLKEMGLAAVAKRVDRVTDNGRVAILIQDNKAAMVEVSCETDFVSENAEFKKLCDNICKKAIEENYTTIEEPLVEMVNALIATINENMIIKRLVVLDIPSDCYVSSYIHGNGSVGVMTVFQADKTEAFENPDFQNFAFQCSMQVCAQEPMYLDKTDVDKKYEQDQLEIFTKQVEMLDKPEKVKKGIISGKLAKHYKEICLNQQEFVFDNPDNLSTEKLLAKFNKELGAKIKISSYYRFKAGSEA